MCVPCAERALNEIIEEKLPFDLADKIEMIIGRHVCPLPAALCYDDDG